MLDMLNAGPPLSAADVSQKCDDVARRVFGPVVPHFSVSRNFQRSISSSVSLIQ